MNVPLGVFFNITLDGADDKTMMGFIHQFFVIFKGDIHHKPWHIRSWLKYEGTKTTTVLCEMKLNSFILRQKTSVPTTLTLLISHDPLYVFWGWKTRVSFH